MKTKQEIIKLSKEVLKEYKDVILSAYLFGSYNYSLQHINSDVDIAILFSKKLNEVDRFKIEVEIEEKLREKLKQEVNLVSIDNASPLLSFNAIRGELIIDNAPAERAIKEVYILNRYHHHKIYFRLFLDNLIKEAKGGNLGIS